MRDIIEVPVISAAIRRLGAPTNALVRHENTLYTCGMPPLDVLTGEIVSGDIEKQTRAVLQALDVTLQFAGSGLDNVVKATVFVTDAAMMRVVNEVYSERFKQGFPARTSAAIKPWPLGFDIEIECIAAL